MNWSVIVPALPEADGITGYVFSITIHPAYRRKGLGVRLVGAVVDDLRERGRKSANTVISDENEASKQLFMSLGFKEAKKMKDYYEAGDVYCLFNVEFS